MTYFKNINYIESIKFKFNIKNKSKCLPYLIIQTILNLKEVKVSLLLKMYFLIMVKERLTKNIKIIKTHNKKCSLKLYFHLINSKIHKYKKYNFIKKIS